MAELTTRSSLNPLIEVPTTTLSDVAKDYGHPKYIKMDIEGAEFQVLQSSLHYLKENHVEMTIDTGHMVGGSFTTDRIEAHLKSIGYSVLSATSDGLVNTWALPPGKSFPM